jgi:hypothetical protein
MDLSDSEEYETEESYDKDIMLEDLFTSQQAQRLQISKLENEITKLNILLKKLTAEIASSKQTSKPTPPAACDSTTKPTTMSPPPKQPTQQAPQPSKSLVKPTYAEQTKKTPAKLNQKQVRNLIQLREAPMEFTRLHLQIQDNRKLKAQKRPDRAHTISTLFKTIGIRKDVVAFSLIGCSVVEFYVAAVNSKEVINSLKEHKAVIIDDFDRFNPPPYLKDPSTFGRNLVTRLSVLISRSRFKKLDEAILEGAHEDLKIAINDRINERKANQENLMDI